MQANERTIEQLEQQNPADYLLIDIRDESAYRNGFIPGALCRAVSDLPALPKDKPLVLYCKKGLISADAADELRDQGYIASSLTGGYVAWLMGRIERQDKTERIEISIRKKFHKAIFSKFTEGIGTYKLLKEGDKVAVCISGGKDSMLMAKLFQELQRHRKFPFELVFLVMDPGYAPENRALIERNGAEMGIPLTLFETDIFDSVANIPKSACYLCARMRRGHLYSKAKELGCNKIALGHHYDDVIETILMGMLWGAQIQTMMPRLRSTNFENMELIRPMYLIREADIKHFRDYHDLHFLQCACRFTDTCSTDGSMASKRTEIKHLIRELKQANPNVEHTIFRSVENVHLNAVIGYKKDGERHHFLDSYEY
ncbi:MAG: rhodanese-like domain-containing protein [Oscillospiraceae bacterium]|nr:rhodanese-like domain-containing protein [Oscillospiraceae bacterium]